MSTLAELERDVYRRGLILTGESAGADHVAEAVLARYDNLHRVGESALLRAIVQEARAWSTMEESSDPSSSPPWTPPTGPPAQLFAALKGLTGQQREAWTLSQLEQLGEVDVARAMDCSRTAMREVHLVAADGVLRPLLGASYEPALASLRAALRSIDPATRLDDVRQRLRKVVIRKRLVRLLMFLVFAIVCATMWWVMTDLHRANDREIELRRAYEAEQQKFSLPMSPEETSP